MRTDPGRTLVESVGITDLATLLKHVLAIAGICVLLRYVTAVYGAADRAARTSRHVRTAAAVHRVAIRASLATVLTMSGVFLFALDRGHSDDPHFMGRHAGEPGLAVYMGLFYLYTGVAAAVCGYQWGCAVRHAKRWTLRSGLSMMSVGMVFAVAYALVRVAYGTFVAFRPVSAGLAAAQEGVTDSLLYACFLLWALGVIAPATQAVINQFRTWRALVVLRPLWRDLALASPELIRYPPSRLFRGARAAGPLNAVRDLLFSGDCSPQTRLGRYVTEIRDVVHKLRGYAPDDLYSRAQRAAEREGRTGREARITAEAYWILVARALMTGSARPSGSLAEFPSRAGNNYEEEISWLLQVRAAYARAAPTTVAELLGRTTSPV
jgi:hypothetical protein